MQPGPAELAPDVIRVLAPNPSALTGPGTNSYILGRQAPLVIDPGPEDPAHLRALMTALGGRPCGGIVVTHAHLDHSALAPALAQATGAPVYAFGGPRAGQSATMARLEAAGLPAGPGLDEGFRFDRPLGHGAVLQTPEGPMRALHVPGHLGNHLCLVRNGMGFSGDLVLGWTSTAIVPPQGDLADYRASLALLQREGLDILYPGHGEPVTDPAARIAMLLSHRQEREDQLRAALAEAPGTPAALALRLYGPLPEGVAAAASATVLSHLLDLLARGLATCDVPPGPAASFAAA
ncbi:MBL fold metallo-hydrolase [Pseudoroseicyclus aestuarii]|nr:MBL fold metallo-hydrolase [Pseudoroseicyclus aestuarii]